MLTVDQAKQIPLSILMPLTAYEQQQAQKLWQHLQQLQERRDAPEKQETLINETLQTLQTLQTDIRGMSHSTLCKITAVELNPDHAAIIEKFFITEPCLQDHWRHLIAQYKNTSIPGHTMQPLQGLPIFITLRGMIYATIYFNDSKYVKEADEDMPEISADDLTRCLRKAAESGHFLAMAIMEKNSLRDVAEKLYDAESRFMASKSSKSPSQSIFHTGAISIKPLVLAIDNISKTTVWHRTPSYVLLAIICSYLGKYYALNHASEKNLSSLNLCQTYYSLALQYIEIAFRLEKFSQPEINNAFWGMPLAIGFGGGSSGSRLSNFAGLFKLPREVVRPPTSMISFYQAFADYVKNDYCGFIQTDKEAAKKLIAEAQTKVNEKMPSIIAMLAGKS